MAKITKKDLTDKNLKNFWMTMNEEQRKER